MSKNPALHSVAMNFLQALLDRGIEHVFANAGTDFAPVIEGLVAAQKAGIRTPEFITVPHENVAIAMAHGYFLATGKPAAVMVHVTVGTANALCGLMNASRDNAPILLMAGRTPSTETGHIGSRNASIHWGQDSFDQGGIVREFVKWDYELRPGQPPEDIVGRALDIAMTEPKGPVYLCMPREVLGDLTETTAVPPRSRDLGASIAAPSTKAIRQTAAWLANAEFPLIITSCSGRDPANVAKLTRIAEDFGIGVSVPGEPGARELNIPLQHPMFLGIHPAEAIAKADVIVALDCEVPWWPSAVTLRENCKLVHIAPDPFFSNYPVRGFQMDLAISGSTAIALCKLEEELKTASDVEVAGSRITKFNALHEERTAARARALASANGSSPVNPLWVAHCINQVKDDNTVVVNELGVPLEYLDLDQPRSYLSSSLAGGLGFGLGAAIGVKKGAPDKNVILIVGDGSYMFGCPTAAHHAAKLHGLPTTTIVMNNARWHAVHRSTLGMYPNGLASKEEIMPLVSLGDSPEYDKIMEACGGHGEKVDKADDLEAALRRCLDANSKGQAALINLIAAF
jgi:acetolactate synthase-1/2/3 large subunit